MHFLTLHMEVVQASLCNLSSPTHTKSLPRVAQHTPGRERDNDPDNCALSPRHSAHLPTVCGPLERPLARRLHHYPFGLRFRSLREMHFEHTMLISGSDLFRVHRGAKHEASAECPRRPLVVMIPALPILSGLTRAFTLQRQHVDVFLGHTR